MAKLTGSAGIVMDIVESFVNDEDGVEAVIVTGHTLGGFSVIFRDTDADETIGVSGGYSTLGLAEEEAESLVATH